MVESVLVTLTPDETAWVVRRMTLEASIKTLYLGSFYYMSTPPRARALCAVCVDTLALSESNVPTLTSK